MLKGHPAFMIFLPALKLIYLNKEKVQNLIAQQRTNLAEVSNLDLNSINNIIENFENASDNLEFRKKRLHQQIKPSWKAWCTGRRGSGL